MYNEKISQIMKLLNENEANTQRLNFIYDNLKEDLQEFEDTIQWLYRKQESCEATVEKIGLRDVFDDWIIDSNCGDVFHKSGGFFKIIGVDVNTSTRESGVGWKQPMVDQGTESSIAGLLKQKQGCTFKYLIEAKFEPGNFGKVVISPTLQVTYSNLQQAHRGRKPLYADLFDGSNPDLEILYEHWLPEDGGRFYLKRVKYMIVEMPIELSLSINDNFRWVSVNSLKKMLHIDNLINPHVRSLLAVL